MALKADFIKDVAVRCTDMLTAAGYTFPPGDDRDSIRTYASVKHRRIPTRPRTVHKAPYTLPPHLTAGEQQLMAKVAAGGDLWPHQSRKIGNVATEDGMLNDYGIQHFHLGTKPDPRRPQLIEGTSELLFAVVKDSDFYALGPRAVLLSPDEKALYVADGEPREGQCRELRAYPIRGDGTLDHPIVLHAFPADHRGQHRGIEGMCLDADGNIVAVGGWQHSGPGPLVYVFRPDGAVTETHPIPADLPNKCCFGGRDLDLFYVTTAGGCLYQARTAREGLSRR